MPTKSDPAKEVMNLKGKVNALSALLRLGHEAFDKQNFQQWSSHVVNNSVLAVHYSRSTLVDMRSGSPKIIAITGQPSVNSNSEFSNYIVSLTRPLTGINKITPLDKALLEQKNVKSDCFEALEYVERTSERIILVPLIPAGGSEDDCLLWIVEFEDKTNAAVAPALLALLSQHYNESLFYILYDRKKRSISNVINRKKMLSPSRVLVALALLFLIAMVVIPVRQNVAAEFEIIPNKENFSYAPFEGIVEKCYFKSGDFVKKDEIILKYDTEERQFNLASTRNAFNKISAQLDMVKQQSFKDISKRGQVRLLELQKEKAAIDIERDEWYLRRSLVKSETSGVLDIGDADKLEGKAVRPGEKLFEVLATDNLIALISVDERNASVLNKNCQATLYLHTRPEMPLTGDIISISPKPVLTERKLYCYLIRLKLDSRQKELICGMRGIARISGAKVSLGYYLFRNLVLWWRKV
ncbi:MAG: efflux RND transporter periplasmic adaptor subunit [Victivallaceae bacterium]